MEAYSSDERVSKKQHSACFLSNDEASLLPSTIRDSLANFYYHQACINVCALNNAGVVLMERGAHELATNTLKDALCIMQMVFKNEPAPPLNVFNFSKDCLRKANQRVSQSSSKWLPPFPYELSEMNRSNTKVVAVENQDVDALQSAAVATSSFAGVLIRSLPVEYKKSLVGDGQQEVCWFGQESGIVFYNYALACIMVSSSTTETAHDHSYWYSHDERPPQGVLVAHRALLMAQSFFQVVLEHAPAPPKHLRRTRSERQERLNATSEGQTQSFLEQQQFLLETCYLDMLVLSCTARIGDTLTAEDAKLAMNSVWNTVESDHAWYIVTQEFIEETLASAA